MSTTTFCCRLLVGMFIILAGMTMPSASASAQANCDCPVTMQKVKVIDICFEGQIRQVEVTYCNETFCPPRVIPDPCNVPNVPISARTVIWRICPIGFVTPNAQGLMNATIAAMGLCCGNKAGIFDCTIVSPEYNWIVRSPKCVYFDATGCLNACPNTPCCGALVRFRPNFPMQGQCETTILADCSDTAPCPPPPTGINCIQLDCHYPVNCCW